MSFSCLVTGGSGFVGSHLLPDLIQDHSIDEIHVIDIKPCPIKHPKIFFHNCDIRKPIELDLKLENAICYHLAAVCKEPGFPWDEYFLTNHIGTKHICEFAVSAGIKNIIFTSTEMVFRAQEKKMLEDSLKAPDTAYGMSKLLAELELKAWLAGDSGRRLRIVRPGVIFGKGENGNFTRLYYALKRGFFPYIGKNTTIKSCIYVKDVVRFLRFVTNDTNKYIDYNLAYPQPTSIKFICDTICEVFGLRAKTPIIPYTPALLAGYAFEMLAMLGLKTSVHHRRIQKLYYSTYIAAERMQEVGFKLDYSLASALLDWKNDCEPEDIF